MRAVWNARAERAIGAGRGAIGGAEAAAEMALIGKAAIGGNGGRAEPRGKELPGLEQAGLQQIRMGAGAVCGTKGAGELKPVGGPGGLGESIPADILGQPAMQPVTRALGDGGRRAAGGEALGALQMRPQTAEDGIQSGVAPQLLAPLPERRAGGADGQAQGRVIAKRRPETGIADRPVAEAVLQPAARQVEHAIRKAAFRAGLPVMRFLRLDENDAARRAEAPGAAAEKILHAVIGDTDQPFIMAMKVIGMAGEAGRYALDAAGRVPRERNAVRGIRGGARQRAVPPMVSPAILRCG